MNATKLGDLLVSAGKITEAQLAQAVEVQSGTQQLLGDVLIGLGFVTAEDVARALAAQLRIPYVEIGDEFRLAREDVRLIPEALARKYCMIPMRTSNSSVLTLVMKDPMDIEAVDVIRSLSNLDVRRAVSVESRIRAVIDKQYSEDAHIERSLQDLADIEPEAMDTHNEGGEGVADADQLRVLANDAPVVQFVNLLLMQAIRDRASDIHFEPEEQKVVVRLRVDGVLKEVTPPPKAIYAGIVTRIKILSDMDIAERRLPLDGRFKFKIRDRIIDIRVSSLPEVFGEKLVLRILDRGALKADINTTGIEPELVKRFQRILNGPHGIVLLTGPTGSGKTSTLYSALNYLKSPELNIQTVEDPVEYLLPGVNQMQTKAKIGLDFANALRSILRQDPDVIMIGEIRDYDTAEIAMRASLTGHLVLSTLHTNDAPSAFSRLRDIGVESYLIAATVRLVISQRLVRIICESCKKEVPPPAELLPMLLPSQPDAGTWTYRAGAGCSHCNKTGYRGRTAIVEFLEVTEPIRELVLSDAGHGGIRRSAIELGMVTLLNNGLGKVRRGVTTIAEVLSVCPLDEIA